MKKKLIKKYREGKNITWDSSRYPLYKELPLRNYYWVPILDDTELIDYATGQPLKSGDAILIDPKTGKPLSPNSDEAIRDYLALINLFEGLADLPEITVTYNKNTKDTTTKVGKSYDDYLEEKNSAPVAASAQLEELAKLNFEANDVIKLLLEKKFADRKANDLTPGIGSLVLLGTVGGMAAWNPLAFAASLGAAKIGEKTVDYPFLQQGYKSFGDWLFQGTNAPELLKLNSNPGIYLGGGFGYNLANLYLKSIGQSAVKAGIRKGLQQSVAEFLNSKQPYIVNDVEAIELGSRPPIKLKQPGVFYSKTGEINKGSFIPRIKEAVSSLFKQDPVWNLMEKVGIPEEQSRSVRITLFGKKIPDQGTFWTNPMTGVREPIANPNMTDDEIIKLFSKGMSELVKRLKSPEFKSLVQKEMGWGELEYNEFMQEINSRLNSGHSITVRGIDELQLGYLANTNIRNDGSVLYTINRDRVAATPFDPVTSLTTTGSHEFYHGLTGGIQGIDHPLETVQATLANKYPRLALVMQHNTDLLKNFLFNEWVDYFANTPKPQLVEDLRNAGFTEKQIADAVEINIPRAIRFKNYINTGQETTARSTTASRFGEQSGDYDDLSLFYTPESLALSGRLLSKVGDINKGSLVSNLRNIWRQVKRSPYLYEKSRYNIIYQSRGILSNLEGQPHKIPVNTPYGLGHLRLDFPWRENTYELMLTNLKLYLDLDNDAQISNLPMQGGFKLTSVPKKGFFGMDHAVPDRQLYDILDGASGLNKSTITKHLQIKNSLDDVKGSVEEDVILPSGSRHAALPKNFSFDRINITLDLNKVPYFSKDDFSAHAAYFSLNNQKVTGAIDEKPLSLSHPIVQASKRYVNYLENKLTDPVSGKMLATVEGSYRAVAEGLPHSPHDVEFLMPEEYFDKVKNIFGVEHIRELPNGFAYEVTAPEFNPLPAGHADFLVIKNGPNGKATGLLAWLIYERLYPKEALELMDSYLLTAGEDVRAQADLPDVESVELPLSAEELFNEYVNSKYYKKKWIHDTHVAKKDKQLKRSPIVTEMFPEEIPNIIHRTFFGAKTLKDLGYNIDYTNVEANKVFCDYFNLPRRYAENPKLMEALVEKNMSATLTTTRGVNIAIPFHNNDTFVNLPINERRQLLFETTNANRMYNASGPGGNSTNQVGKIGRADGMDREVSIIKQLHLDDPTNISQYKTPADIIKRLKLILKISKETENEFLTVNSFDPKDVYKTRELAKKYGLTFWSKFNQYGANGLYVGWVSPEDAAHLMRYVGDEAAGYEAMNAASILSTGENYWPMSLEAINTLSKFIEEAVLNNPELNTLLRRYKFSLDTLHKMYKIGNFKDNLKTGLMASLPLALMGGISGFIIKDNLEANSIDSNLELDFIQELIQHSEAEILNIDYLSQDHLRFLASVYLDLDSSEVTLLKIPEIKNKIVKAMQKDIADKKRRVDMYERKLAANKRKNNKE